MELDLSHHRMTDHDWYYKYELEMGEDKFRTYINKVWATLDKMVLGQHLDIVKYVSAENYDLFIKICCLYIEEKKTWCYEFNNQYTRITYRYDAQEMARTAALFAELRRKKELRPDGTGTESEQSGTKSVPTPQ